MKDVQKLSTVVLWASMIITAIVFGLFYYHLGREQAPETGSIITWLYILTGLCLLAVIGFTIIRTIRRWRNNHSSLIPSLVWLVSAFVVLLVSYFLSKSNARADDDAWALMADMSLYSLYILLGLTCIALFAGIIWSYIKRTR